MSDVFGEANIALLSNSQVGATTLTAASTTLYTPTAGKKLRLRWLSLSSLSTGTECLVTVLFGGQTIYVWGLPAPGAFSRRSIRQADNANDPFVVTLSPAGGPVYLNFELEEV